MTGRTIKALVAVALAAVLAGCGGGPVKAGAAAIVGGDRISTATLGEAVQDWRSEFRADSVANQIRAESQPLPEPETSNAIIQLLLVRVYDEAGRRAGVRASDGQVDLGERFLNERFGSAASYARARGLPARYSRDLARMAFLEQELARKFAPQQQQAMLSDAIRGLNIKLNPRYGTFDSGKLQFGPSRPTLSSPASGTG